MINTLIVIGCVIAYFVIGRGVQWIAEKLDPYDYSCFVWLWPVPVVMFILLTPILWAFGEEI